MSTDARLSTGLPAHPKTKKLIRRVGEGGAWALVCLILWARANRPDGDLSGMTGEDIELAIDWRGEPDALVAALCAVGFLDGEEGAYQLHDWEDHQPWAAGSDMRSLKAKWNAVKRHHGPAEADRLVPEYAAIRATGGKTDASSTASDASSTSAAMHAAQSSNAVGTKIDAPSPSPSPSPSPKAKATTADAVVVASKPATPDCPHSEIVAAYHELLPTLRRVREWTPDRQAFLRARWREKPERQSLDWWRGFFEYVAGCPLLMGEVPGRDGGAPFSADLEWLVRPTNFRKVIEGRYQRRAA